MGIALGREAPCAEMWQWTLPIFCFKPNRVLSKALGHNHYENIGDLWVKLWIMERLKWRERGFFLVNTSKLVSWQSNKRFWKNEKKVSPPQTMQKQVSESKFRHWLVIHYFFTFELKGETFTHIIFSVLN